ncbi:MAG: hypothetical protein SGJ27_07380 [Candidatus Melainabacteria bacterium]|nr:hypothetical protein [Candidatus Melainabacteria bacterium]
MKKNKNRRHALGASMAELGPAMFAFFLFILFPLINFLTMATGASTLYLLTKQAASKAGSSTTFGQGLIAADEAAYSIETGGFGKFAKLVPIGGFNGSGVDLYITETNINTNVSTRNGPNTPFVTNPVDPDVYLYSYDAVATFEIGPFMELGGIPWIGSVPGVGLPARLTYTASEQVEHPEGIITGIAPADIPDSRNHNQNINGHFDSAL